MELKKWLKRHGDLLVDETANVVFVTNMTRREEKDWNGYAGIEGLLEIRKLS